tara:strand:+ start:2245 stop:2682 length:438 start_codon:yes stop_codon:yes gene_type:complete
MKIEILPGLWIGTLNYLENSEFLKDKNIKFLVNCEEDLNFLGKSINYNDDVRKNMEKYEKLKFSKYLNEITKLIYNKIKQEINVIVCCKDNLEKSPTVILCYLIKYGKLNLENSLDILKTKYPHIFENGIKYKKIIINFMEEIFK